MHSKATSGRTLNGRSVHLGYGHPLASVAHARCLELHGPSYGRIGRTACGACWERVIRDDERAAILFGLPRELDTDPDYVDVVAVERACAWQRQVLTPAERAVAIRRLAGRGYGAKRIARCLRMTAEQVSALLAEPARNAADHAEAA